ncbi:MAG: hypothetical protein PHT33_01165, partial [bacterium]|nr:hypothetical protein [bacterium]
LADPKHPEHKQNKRWFAGFAWYGGTFKPETFDLEVANLELARYLRWARDRSLYWGICLD